MLTVERDVKPQNMNLAKVGKRGLINREGSSVQINTVLFNRVASGICCTVNIKHFALFILFA